LQLYGPDMAQKERFLKKLHRQKSTAVGNMQPTISESDRRVTSQIGFAQLARGGLMG